MKLKTLLENFNEFDDYTQKELYALIPTFNNLYNIMSSIHIELKKENDKLTHTIERFLNNFKNEDNIMKSPDEFISELDRMSSKLKRNKHIDSSLFNNFYKNFNNVKKHIKTKNLNLIKSSNKQLEQGIDKLINSFK